MAFTKRDVKDRVVQYPRRYQLVEVSAGVYDLVPVTGTVTEAGTAINKAYLQPIEDNLSGICDGTLSVPKATDATVAQRATKLDTARKINGVNFDGTSDITIADGTKAPTSHANSGNTYGLGSPTLHGHCKTINALTQASHVDGTALSAYQGKLLSDLIAKKELKLYGTYSGTANAPFNITIPTDWSELRVYIVNLDLSNTGQFGVGFNGNNVIETYAYKNQSGHARFDIDKLSSNFVTIRSFNGNATGSANVTVTDLTKLFIAAIPYNCTVYVFLKQ